MSIIDLTIVQILSPIRVEIIQSSSPTLRGKRAKKEGMQEEELSKEGSL